MRGAVILWGVLAISASAGGELDRQWKARALQAVEKIDSLSKAMEKKQDPELLYSAMIEMAYANFLSPDLKSVVHKKTSVTNAYHLFFRLPESDSTHDFLDIVYLYDVKTEEFLGVRVDRLPSYWSINPSFPQRENLIAFSHHTSPTAPSLIFSKTNPFDYLVLRK